MLDSHQIENKLVNAFPNTEIAVEGDGHHFRAKLIGPSFEGKSRVQRHQMVYSVVNDWIVSGVLHALELKIYTQTEWQQEWTN